MSEQATAPERTVTTLRARLALGLAIATAGVPALLGTLGWIGVPVRGLITVALAFSSASGIVAVAQASLDLALASRRPEQRRAPAIAALVLVLIAPLIALAASYAIASAGLEIGLVHGGIGEE